MTPAELLGCRVTLKIVRFTGPGAYLAIDDADARARIDDPDATILLPLREVPEGAHEGDPVSVFVHLDSEDRPIATTREPRLALGEVTFLTVTAVTDIGAFVDWGLGKELLVPFKEQSRELFVGERQPIGLYVDNTGRLAGTMYVTDMLDRKPRRLALDEWVVGEAWRNDPDIGLFVIIERSFVGLVPASEPHPLKRGDSARFRVTNILADGKIVLSLRQHAYQELEADAAKILAALRLPGAPRLGDRSNPDEIRTRFGISKKAFKRAIGRLLKDGTVELDAEGYVVVKQ
ncbi:MAG: nucleic acid-binding protein [Deltaproteobacteria bacterium]|nr:nucleic acid-binding protein [Deltaproteobacteria bacterium]MDQ3299104.1 S1-like domain-containing RNA-binding protein [Myxococcota bacterium]